MPGKHAPESPKSFYLSVGRAAGGAAVALGVIIAIAVIAVSSHGSKPEAKRSTGPTSTPAISPTVSAVVPSPSPTPTRTISLPPHSKVSVNVLNGTAQNGLAGKVAAALRKQGYDVTGVGNAPTPAAATTIYYRSGQKALAQRLLREHPEFKRIAPFRAVTATTPVLSVMLGDDYKAP